MRNITIILLAILSVTSFYACEKDETKIKIDKATFKAASLTAPAANASIVLTKADATETMEFAWQAADYGTKIAIQYTVQACKHSNNFAKKIDIANSATNKLVVTHSDFNAKMAAIELESYVSSAVDVRLMAVVPGASLDTLYSSVISFNVTPYLAKDAFYLVGDFNGWKEGLAWEMNRYVSGLKYEQYIYLSAWKGFKVLPKLGSWEGDMGADPAKVGGLVATGENNLEVSTDGYYLMTFDMGDMTYSAVKTTWGIVGVGGDWNANIPMTFDIATQNWTVTRDMPVGTFKFWANSGWTYNYGSAAGDGTLQLNKDNLSIATAGNYTITMNLKSYPYKYSIIKN